MLTFEQFKEMFDMQEQLEQHISGPDWREQGHDYPLCVHMEAAEIIDHFPWKHWKAGPAPDLDAVAMEVVDVWHFAMAFMLMANQDLEDAYEALKIAQENWDAREETAVLAHVCIGLSFMMYSNGQFPFGNFVILMSLIDMTFDDLYKLYISKNVLNKFRQDHGYKDGTYLKNWGGREDNEHLYELCDQLDEDLTGAKLYEALSLRYQLVTK